jgi:multicomponent Na+:H+ antiporter subunit A
VIASIVLGSFGVALLLSLIPLRSRWGLLACAGVPPLATLLVSLGLLPGVADTPYREVYPWVPQLGVALDFYLDGLSLLFGLLISGIGLLVVVYAAGYFDKPAQLRRFYAMVLAFMGAMLGIVLAGNTLTLFVFWELTSITSFLLIGFKPDDDASRAGALRAFMLTGSGGLALLGGLVIVGTALGSYSFVDWLAQPGTFQNHSLYGLALPLILLGCFTKSAQVPFHFWLPGAMAAPTPVSAYLHSATMVKAGIYLLARLSPVLGGTDAWQLVVGGVGTLTLLVGAFLALLQTDLKALLAYGTISQLGALTALLGASSPSATIAAVVGVWAHAAYKGALFLIVGAVDHSTGTRDIRRLRNLRLTMPRTAAVAAVAGLSMAGLPPLMGFISKELLFEAGLPHGTALTAFQSVQLGLTVVAAALTVAYALVAVWGVFFARGTPDTPHEPHEAPWLLLFGPAVLGGVTLLGGLAPQLLERWVFTGAVAGVLCDEEPLDLALWHGLNAALALSVLSLLVGVVVYRLHLRWAPPAARALTPFNGARLYERAVAGVEHWSQRVIDTLQHGRLRLYLATIFVALALLVGGTTLVRVPFGLDGVAYIAPTALEIATAALIVLATLGTLLARTRLGAIAALGGVGYLVSFMFVLLNGPDLALTQLLVETLTLIIFLLAFYFLPTFFERETARFVRARDGLIALAVGATMTLLVLIATTLQLGPPVGDEHLARSVPEGEGRNVVNVILVDFRGFDTLGEITVLAVAALGIYALVRLRLHGDDETGERQRRQRQRQTAVRREVVFEEAAARDQVAAEDDVVGVSETGARS